MIGTINCLCKAMFPVIRSEEIQLAQWRNKLCLPGIEEEDISDREITRLFRDNGAPLPPQGEKRIREYFGTHQSALKLGITYLKTQQEFVPAFEKIPVILGSEVEGYNIHRLMMAFEQLWADSADIACLYVLALFPYPVSQELLRQQLSTVSKPHVSLSAEFRKLSAIIKGYSDNQLTDLLHKLEQQGFLLLDEGKIKTFQPVQAYFESRFKTLFFHDWQQLQHQLSKHYRERASQSGASDNNIGKFWLACKGLMHSTYGAQKKQALSTIYEPLISPYLQKSRPNSSHGNELNLYLLKPFFQQLWHKPDFSLDRTEKNRLLTWAGHSLYQLGEAQQAVELLEQTLPELTRHKSWALAGQTTALLSEYAAKQQDTLNAIELGKRSVAYSDLSNDPFALLPRLVRLMELYETNNYLSEAGALLHKAEHLLTHFAQQEATQVTTALSHMIERLKINEQQLVSAE